MALGIVLAWAATATAADPPQIPSSWVENVTATGALLRAEVNPDGSATTYHFEYLTEAAYLAGGESFGGATSTPSAGAGSGTASLVVFANLAGLAPATAYRYRPVATNTGAGTTIGPEHVLVTSEAANVYPPIDGRGYELVSPVDKGGGAVGTPESIFGGGDFQAAPDGGSFTFSSTSSFGEAAGAPPASQYLAQRGPAGWSTRDISAPLQSGGYGDKPDGSPFRVFSPDLSRALMLNGARCAIEGTCSPSYSLWEGNSFSVLPTATGLRLVGASPDLRHAIFSAASGLYEWSGGALEAVSETPGAALAAPVGAISEDGRRLYFTEGGSLYLHEGSAPPRLLAAGDELQSAGADGSIAFYTTEEGPEELHLFRYKKAASSSESVATRVKGVLGSSEDGSIVYYQDAAGLRQWHEGTVTQIAAGADVAAASDYPPATGTARVSADGLHLAFLSLAAIPPFDNTDAKSGGPDTELYLYGPAPAGGGPPLLCVSCNPTGERPRGSASIPGTVANGSTRIYRPRVLSASGSRVFFDSADQLVAPDTDSRPDVYEWEAGGVGDCTRSPGCIGLVSGGRGEGGTFLDASANGDDAFFLTEDSLVGSDPGSIDVYDARSGGGFAEPEQPIACLGDACQALPSPPEDPTPGTSLPSSGNPAPKYFKPHRKRKHHRHKKHHKHRKRHHRRGKR